MAEMKTQSLITITDLNDAPVGILSNESVTLTADQSGVVSSFAAAVTTFSITLGGVDDSANWTVSVAGTPVGITGSLAGRTYTVQTMSADTGYVDLQATKSGFSPIVKRFTLAKAKQGITGSRTAVLEMYQWKDTAPTTFPSGTSVYTWASGTFVAPGTPNNWTINPGSGSAGQTLWVCKTIYSNSNTDLTSTVTWNAAVAYRVGYYGTSGTNGRRTAVIEMYKWSAAAPTTYPTGTASVYTWANGTFTDPGTLNGWSRSIGASTPGWTLYGISQSYSDTSTTSTSNISWTSTTVYPLGYAGTNGSNGNNGKTYVGNIVGGVRSITFDANGSNPAPAQTAFSCEFFEDGVAKTPATYAWSATGHLSGTSSAATFTPTCASSFSANNSDSVNVTLTYNGQTLKLTVPIAATKVGTSGLNSAVVFLYKRSGSEPAKPSTQSTYTFSTGALTGHDNGWTQAVPASNGNPLWVTQATATATAPTNTDTIASTEWSTPIKMVENGTAGNPGYSQTTLYLYQRQTSAPSTSTIADTTTYTFSTNSLTGTITGWTRTIPSGTNPIYVTTAVAYGNTASVNIARSSWATPVVLSQNGADGKAITLVDVEYAKNSSPTVVPTGTAPENWSTAAPTWESGKYIWSRVKTTYSSGSPTYTNAACITGQSGATGRGITSIVEQYAVSTSKTTEPSQASFSTNRPTWEPGKYVWTRSLITYTSGSPATSTTTPVVSSEWEAVNEIQVGGRNLILQSDTIRNSVTATLQTYNISEAFTSRVYTFSMRVVGATGTTYTLKQNNGTTSLGSLVSDANGIFSLTFASSQTEEYLQTFLITQSPLPSEENSIIWAKLEYGNKYTDYTQAPEDIEAQINDLIERTNTNETDINRKITVFTGTQTPTGAKTGDIWINENDGNRQYIYGEGMWTLFGKTDLDLLNEQINAISNIAFGGANVYRQISAPSSQHENDMWIDTDDNSKVYTYKGGNWVVVANFNNLLKMINDIDVSIKDGSTLSTLLDSNSILQKLKDNLRLDSDYVKNTAEYDSLMRSISDGLQGLNTTVYGDPAVGIASLESLINAQKLDEGLKALLSGYNVYMRQAGQYPNDYLQIARKQGDVVSPFEIRITNERIDFMYQGESIAHCSTSDFNMEIATIDQYSRHIYRNPATGAKVGEFQMIAVDGGLQGLWISTTT